jgi:NAD(P)-dependent dehydrogenase (short-subunit alcohol dehydrogenase family)
MTQSSAMSSDVFITGANKGLGSSLVEAFVADGFRVFSGYRAAMGKLDELVRRHPERVVPVVVDVTDAASTST